MCSLSSDTNGRELEEDEESDDEDLAEADEDESDLDLAWKMLDVARAIVEKHSAADTMEKVDILSALAEVALERGLCICVSLSFLFLYHDFCWMKSFGTVTLKPVYLFIYSGSVIHLQIISCLCLFHVEDFETSLSDYQKALSILEHLVEPDSRHIAELYPFPG